MNVCEADTFHKMSHVRCQMLLSILGPVFMSMLKSHCLKANLASFLTYFHSGFFLDHSGMHAGRSLYLFTTGCPKKKVGLADKLTNIAPEGRILFLGHPVGVHRSL